MTTIKRNCQIVMLPSDDKVNYHQLCLDKNHRPNRLILMYSEEYSYAKVQEHNQEPQNLYILSNDEIKVDDWVLVQCSEIEVTHIRKVTGYYNEQFLFDNNNQIYMDYCTKIIATTDKTLGLPQIPKEFIEAYILSYNMGSMNTITEIMVEYEDFISSNPIWNSKNPLSNVIVRPRVDINNCIIITAVKTTYSKEEVKALLHNLAKEMYKRGIIFNPESTEKWIEQNLQ